MFTITNGIILKGQNLIPSKENIVVDDGKIINIGKDLKEGKIIDVEGAVVCPSFINGHIHIGDSIIKDEGYGLSLSEMVKPPDGVKHKALANACDDELIEAMKQSMWDMVRSGTTHFIDYREGGLDGIKLLKKASEDIPIKPVILGRDNSFYGDDPDLSKVKSEDIAFELTEYINLFDSCLKAYLSGAINEYGIYENYRLSLNKRNIII